MISGFTNNLKLFVGKEMQIDEMEYFTKGKPSWFIDTIDPESKFRVSSSFFEKRGIEEVRQVLSWAKTKDNNINHVTTDGFHVYKHSVKRIFFRYGHD